MDLDEGATVAVTGAVEVTGVDGSAVEIAGTVDLDEDATVAITGDVGLVANTVVGIDGEVTVTNTEEAPLFTSEVTGD